MRLVVRRPLLFNQVSPRQKCDCFDARIFHPAQPFSTFDIDISEFHPHEIQNWLETSNLIPGIHPLRLRMYAQQEMASENTLCGPFTSKLSFLFENPFCVKTLSDKALNVLTMTL